MQLKKVAITGGSGHIAYSLVFRIAHGDVFGKSTAVALQIYDLPACQKALEGLAMELEDCAFPLLHSVHFGDDLRKTFADADCALLIGAKPRGPGMERADLLRENGKIFKKEGKALNEVAKESVRVLVVGNPCNTNCLIAMHHAPRIPRKHFHAMMRLDQNRAQALLAKQAGVSCNEVKQMIILGNHSVTQVPDFLHAEIRGKKVTEVITDREWLQGEFFTLIQKRGAAIIAARGKSSAASAANAVIDTLKTLYHPERKGEWFSSAVCSDDNPYGLEKGLIFGLPCRSLGDGDYEIVAGLSWDHFMREKISVTQKELMLERESVHSLLT